MRLRQKCVDDEIKTISRGYIAELDWQEKMSKRHYQVLCDRCKRYHIWKKKETQDETTS